MPFTNLLDLEDDWENVSKVRCYGCQEIPLNHRHDAMSNLNYFGIFNSSDVEAANREIKKNDCLHLLCIDS